MNKTRRQMLLGSGGLLAAGVLPAPLFAADDAWPRKPIRLIVPNVPGGGIDILGRLLQLELTKIWSQPVVIEYKPGANTVVGTDVVARSPADGYTLGMVVTSHVINPSLRKEMPFDTIKDLAGVSLTATSGILLSASPKLPVSNLRELIAYAKANRGKLTYATPGAGSAMHLSGELLKATAGSEMLHVAYKGSGGAYTDVMDGRVDLLIDPLFASLPHVASKRLKPIAVMSAKRDFAAPDIPAAGETLQGFDVQSINGIVVPRATPRPLVERISRDLATAVQSDELKKRFADVGLEPRGSTPDEFDAYVKAEIDKWANVVKTAHVTLD